MYFINFCFFIFSINTGMFVNHDSLPNPKHLKIISNRSAYLIQKKSSPENEMVDVRNIIPDIFMELIYATPDNFTHTPLYPPASTTFLRKPAALALQKIQEDLKKRRLALKIWDAYRPYSATLKMWELVHDERYVANPSKGSGHNKGIAVDLTIVSLNTGRELNMGTGFDNFTDSAHHDFKKLSDEVIANRSLLREIMTSNGFTPLETEWWHYFYGNGQFDILNLSFADLSDTSTLK